MLRLLIGQVGLTLVVQSVFCFDVFTSVNYMNYFYNQETQLLHLLRQYTNDLETKIHLLVGRYKELVEHDSRQAEKEPLGAFQLMKRMVREWPLVLSLMAETFEIPPSLVKLTTEKDVEGAMQGLVRLQEVYGGTFTSMFLKDNGSNGVTGDDMYELGKHCFRERKYEMARFWLQLAQTSSSSQDQSRRPEILAYLYLVDLYDGCKNENKTKRNTLLLHELLNKDKTLVLNSDLTRDLRTTLTHNCSIVNASTLQPAAGAVAKINKTEAAMFERICREGTGVPEPGLRCYYVRYGRPQLLLAPFKLEELHKDPPVVMIHEAIYDHEVAEFTRIFYHTAEECEILSRDVGEVVSRFRTCNVAWITDDMTPISAIVTRRMGDLSGLSVSVAEYNQVVSYGVSGEFNVHLDAFPQGLSANDSIGNRIATVLVYMNDVMLGGETVFPYLNLAVAPRKGSAVVWFNTHRDSTSDQRLVHGSCPVLLGHKWIMNKWIREGGQEFQFDCPLDRNASRKNFYL